MIKKNPVSTGRFQIFCSRIPQILFFWEIIKLCSVDYKLPFLVPIDANRPPLALSFRVISALRLPPMDDSCAVCADHLDWVAYGPCGHREVCSTCVVRLRFVLGDRRCCICKSDCPTIFVTKVPPHLGICLNLLHP